MKPSTTEGSAIAHIPALDGLRGVAILLVLMMHFGVAADFPTRSGLAFGRALERFFYIGWTGVDLFFVLSGFLITSILLASRTQPGYFRRFYGRRMLRIFPLYYIFLILTLIVAPAALAHVSLVGASPALVELKSAPAGQIWLWTYFFNVALVFGWIGGVDLLEHFWTLAIEEQYYLVWPWIVRNLSRRRLAIACVTLLAGALILRILWMAAGWGWRGAYRFTLTRVDALAAGGLVAILVASPSWRSRLTATAPYGALLTFAILGVMFLRVPHFYPSEPMIVTLGHSLLAGAFSFLVLISLREPAPRWLRGKTLGSLGKYSYGIYVWHWPLQRTMLWLYPGGPLQSPLMGTLAAVGFLASGVIGAYFLGWVSYKLIESPFLKLKWHLTYVHGPLSSSPEADGPIADLLGSTRVRR